MPPPTPSETLLSPSNLLLFGREVKDLKIDHAHDHNPFVGARKGANGLLEDQITEQSSDDAESARFARIYGFSFEGTYYDLPRPVLFLVHGEGEDAEEKGSTGRAARAPDDPSRSGMAAADHSFAENLKVWSYDKADHTIRMDVETGTFEQVLLNIFFAEGGGARVSGAMVGGAMVGGAMVGGPNVRGAMVGGAMLRGRRGGRGDPND